MNVYFLRAKSCWPVLLLVLAGFFPVEGWSQTDANVRMQFPDANITDVLPFYQNLTGRHVYLALGVNAPVNLIIDDPVSRAAAVELIRKTLLESCGVELRDIDDNVTLAGWSQDPKYPHQIAPPAAMPPIGPGNNNLPKRNFRPPFLKPLPTPESSASSPAAGEKLTE